MKSVALGDQFRLRERTKMYKIFSHYISNDFCLDHNANQFVIYFFIDYRFLHNFFLFFLANPRVSLSRRDKCLC